MNLCFLYENINCIEAFRYLILGLDLLLGRP